MPHTLKITNSHVDMQWHPKQSNLFLCTFDHIATIFNQLELIAAVADIPYAQPCCVYSGTSYEFMCSQFNQRVYHYIEIRTDSLVVQNIIL